MSVMKQLMLLLACCMVVFGFLATTIPALAATKEKVLYSFKNNGKPEAGPEAGVIFDAAGNLYGTTYGGGVYGLGKVFELTPKAGGDWGEKILHSFSGQDGADPSAGLIFDEEGNLYGTTTYGGSAGYGTVFELSPNSDGTWTESVLYSFTGGQYGAAWPSAGVILDTAGRLYGTTTYGGAYGWGTAFELVPNPDGTWTGNDIYDFCALTRCGDGELPMAGLILDSAGNLYGTTVGGGPRNLGAVFELTPNAGGGWSETVIDDFGSGHAGSEPKATLIVDSTGNLYSTTYYGGLHNHGTAFELTPNGNGGWVEKVLHAFRNNGKDGMNPSDALILGASGKLYGTTRDGRTDDHHFGTVFELTPKKNGRWTERLLYVFCSGPGCPDGAEPSASVILDATGNLYGTTYAGGAHRSGTVFEIIP
jgi:uncharacterized repeat protein (TIGR03803 family)